MTIQHAWIGLIIAVLLVLFAPLITAYMVIAICSIIICGFAVVVTLAKLKEMAS